MKAVVSLRIAKNKVFFGPGTAELLTEIDRKKSLKGATVSMNLSYTKALRMIRDMENELGFPVVESTKGGKAYGGTVLTSAGRAILENYLQIEEKVKAYAENIVEEEFKF